MERGGKMADKITILAIGGAGCRIMKEFTECGFGAEFDLLALDSDVTSLQVCGLPESSLIQAGKMWRSGRGCGGDVMAGHMAVANERKTIAARLAGTKILIVIAGLGGGLASGGVPVVLGEAARQHITSVLLTTLPFAMEGFRRRKLADERIAGDILPVADAVISLPNDILFNTLDAEVPLADAFRFSDQQMARSLFAIAAIFGGGNLFNADFASFTGVLKRRHTLCSLGVGVVDGNDIAAPDKVLEKLLDSPMLGGPETFTTADAVAFALLGGNELSLGSARAVLDLAVRQIDPRAEKEVLLGAATNNGFAGKIQLTALAVRYLDVAVTEKTPGGKRKTGNNRHLSAASENSSGEQLELTLDTENKGIMENTVPVIIDGEDMDIPAYKRRRIVLDKGK